MVNFQPQIVHFGKKNFRKDKFFYRLKFRRVIVPCRLTGCHDDAVMIVHNIIILLLWVPVASCLSCLKHERPIMRNIFINQIAY